MPSDTQPVFPSFISALRSISPFDEYTVISKNHLTMNSGSCESLTRSSKGGLLPKTLALCYVCNHRIPSASVLNNMLSARWMPSTAEMRIDTGYDCHDGLAPSLDPGAVGRARGVTKNAALLLG